MIVLWTDALIYFLLLILCVLFFFMRRQEHLKRPLRQIGESKTAMVSLVILIFFVLIGLVDSIHFKTADQQTHEIISLLDYWATPLREHSEKTYSAPFAYTQYSKEIQPSFDGSVQWGYPRLLYGGIHLTDPENQRLTDILQTFAKGSCRGLVLVVITWIVSVAVGRIRNSMGTVQSASGFSSYQAVWLTLIILLSSASALVDLSANYHVFGTDKVGEDVFYQTLKSIRTGLVIGTLTTLVMLPMAIIFGILAGFFQGWVDDLIQYLYTTLNSIPSVLLIAASILMVQVYMTNHEADFTSVTVRADTRLLFLCLILGVTSWTGLCRLLRGETLKIREMEYVQAAYALGVRQSTILLRHVLPNVMHIVLISVVLDFSSLVLAEAVLSYINIGVDPSSYSWGNMINNARLEMARDPMVWWSLTAAFVFMFTLVLAANLFADVVQDAFDPRRSRSE